LWGKKKTPKKSPLFEGGERVPNVVGGENRAEPAVKKKEGPEGGKNEKGARPKGLSLKKSISPREKGGA